MNPQDLLSKTAWLIRVVADEERRLLGLEPHQSRRATHTELTLLNRRVELTLLNRRVELALLKRTVEELQDHLAADPIADSTPEVPQLARAPKPATMESSPAEVRLSWKARLRVAYVQMLFGAIDQAGLWGRSANRSFAVFSVHGLIGLASLLAGRRRAGSHDEWRAHLGGESGHDQVAWLKVRQALGCVAAAILFRLGDAADLAWRPTDAVLKSRAKSNLFVWLPVLGLVLAVVHHDGWYGPIANAENLIETWIGLYAAVRVGRWYRKVKPPAPRPRRAGMAAGEDGQQEDPPEG